MADSTRKRRPSSLLDPAVAALAAVSAGFVAFAMPEDLFSAIIVKSRLPNVLAAAQPPLGETARLAAVAAAALFAFAFVWSVLRALGGGPARVAVRKDEAGGEPEQEVLRLRKADAHPDAPPRRPILAGRDLGEPFADEPDERLLELRVREAEAETSFQPKPLPAFLVPEEPASEPVEPEPVAEVTPEPVPDIAPEPVAEVDTLPEAEEPEAETPESAADECGDLSRLMEKFETGLVRKQQAIVRPTAATAPDPVPPASAPPAPAAEAPATAPAPAEDPGDRVGHRLRSAIAELQKTSVRG